MLNRWLGNGESMMPRYPFTQIGVGGCVFNSRNEVLMVKERIAAVKAAEGQWKLPGGVADPGEDLEQTAAREVLEECGVQCSFESIATMRHAHGYAHGMDDLYLVLRMRASSDVICSDAKEIAEAAWISRPRVEELSAQGLINTSNKKTLDLCFDGVAIKVQTVPSVRGGFTKLYFGSNQSPEHENLIRLFSTFDHDGTGLIKTEVIKRILLELGLSEPHVDSLLSLQKLQGD